jgi:hypothetical protein
MSMRKTNIVERHFEKVILAVVALGMLAWLGMDLMMVGKTPVKMGSQQVPLDQVNEELRKKASKVAANLRSAEVAVQGLEPVDATAGDPSSMFALPSEVAKPLPRAQLTTATGLFNPDLSGRQVWYHEPSFGPLSMLPVQQWEGALSAETLAKETALAAALDTRQGWAKGDRNVICTMPAAKIDLAAIREELKREQPTSSPPRVAVPPAWRNSSVTVVDVVFERQERQSDGRWGPSTIVPTLPGRMTLRGMDPKEPGPIFEAMRANPTLQQEILQPSFFPLAGGSVPELCGGPEASDEDLEIVTLRAEVRRRQEELKKVQEDLDAAGGE